MAQSQIASDHNATVLDNASKMTPDQAVALAKNHIEDHHTQGASVDRFRDMGMNARGSADYRKELEKVPELAKGAKDALTIGEPMPKAEWSQAKELAGGNSGRVYLPKILADYSGKIIMVTESHVVQQAGKNSVIAHDLRKLTNRDELLKLNVEGKLQGKVLKVNYDSVGGNSEVLSFTQVRAAEVQKTAKDYAEQNIKTPAARENFLKHVEKMMAAELERGKAPQGPAQQPARAPQRDQERAR